MVTHASCESSLCCLLAIGLSRDALEWQGWPHVGRTHGEGGGIRRLVVDTK